MAVYTRLTSKEIADFLQQNYAIGDFIFHKEIIDGIDNSNFIINTTSGKFILTIFESRINKDDLPFFMDLKLYLADYGICCPKPVKNNLDSIISTIKNKPAAIVSFLDGKTLKPEDNGLYSSITTNHCRQIAKILANLHNEVINFKGVRENDLGIFGWRVLFNKIADKIDNYQNGLRQEIEIYLNFLEQHWITTRNDLGYGIIHADLFPDNVFFDQNNNLSGIIDFYFAASDLFIYDLAIVINAWCFDKTNHFDIKKYDIILQEYQKEKNPHQEFSKTELNFLKIALVGASLRFLLTRLHDLLFTQKDSLVKIKDPQEYLQKIRYFYWHNYIKIS